jgi:hypothetical protein
VNIFAFVVEWMPLVRERSFGPRRVVRGHGERRLAQPEKAGTDLFGSRRAVMPGTRVRAAIGGASALAGACGHPCERGTDPLASDKQQKEIFRWF